nr:MAG TPA: hypothetical protein [Caudoviricetes sp.]
MGTQNLFCLILDAQRPFATLFLCVNFPIYWEVGHEIRAFRRE